MKPIACKPSEPLQQQARALVRQFEQIQGAWLADRFERLSADIQASEQRRRDEAARWRARRMRV